MDIKLAIGQRIKDLRNKKGISQGKLAEFSEFNICFFNSPRRSNK
jgi:transcriptional regulator with XRE-family HTH domain